MRPLLAVLHERTPQSLLSTAHFWGILETSDPAELPGQLYPWLTDAWAIALALERIGPLARQALTWLAQQRRVVTPSELARQLGVEEPLLLGVLRRLYVAGLLESQLVESVPHLSVPLEIARTIQRLAQEAGTTFQQERSLSELLDGLTDREILELAEAYGMRVLPTVTPRTEAFSFLLARLSEPAILAKQRQALPRQADELLSSALASPQALLVTELLDNSRWSFGELCQAIVRLARIGFLWRVYLQGKLALEPLPTLSRIGSATTPLQPLSAVHPLSTTPPYAVLVDLTLLLAALQQQRISWPIDAELPRSLFLGPNQIRLVRADPVDSRAYLVFLRRLASIVGLLPASGRIDRSRLSQWLRLPFTEQSRRLFKAWQHTTSSAPRPVLQRLFARLRKLDTHYWYEWIHLFEHDEQGDEQSFQIVRELDWLGILATGRAVSSILAIRMTAWGRWLLSGGSIPPTPMLPGKLSAPGCPTLFLRKCSLELIWLASRLGKVEQSTPELAWTITPETVASYVRTALTAERTLTLDQIQQHAFQALTRLIQQPLPEIWHHTLLRWFAHSRPVLVQGALLLHFATPQDQKDAQRALQAAGIAYAGLSETQLLITPYETRQRSRIDHLLEQAGFVLEWPRISRRE